MSFPASAEAAEAPSTDGPTSEQTATTIIRDLARVNAELDSRYSLKQVPKGYVHPFYEFYRPPHTPRIGIEEIRTGLATGFGEYTIQSFIATLVESPAVRKAVEVVQGGGRVALLGSHRELSDTGVMLGAFQAATIELRPYDDDMPERLNQKSRIIVGTMMEELAPSAIDRSASATDALRFLGGVFKIFPDTETTAANVGDGLDPDLKNRVNIPGMLEFRQQVRASEISVVALAPSGSVDKFDADKREFVLGEVSTATPKLMKDFYWLPIAMQLAPVPDFRVGEISSPDEGVRNMDQFMARVLAPLCSQLDPEAGTTTRYANAPTA